MLTETGCRVCRRRPQGPGSCGVLCTSCPGKGGGEGSGICEEVELGEDLDLRKWRDDLERNDLEQGCS